MQGEAGTGVAPGPWPEHTSEPGRTATAGGAAPGVASQVWGMAAWGWWRCPEPGGLSRVEPGPRQVWACPRNQAAARRGSQQVARARSLPWVPWPEAQQASGGHWAPLLQPGLTHVSAVPVPQVAVPRVCLPGSRQPGNPIPRGRNRGPGRWACWPEAAQLVSGGAKSPGPLVPPHMLGQRRRCEPGGPCPGWAFSPSEPHSARRVELALLLPAPGCGH